MSKSLSEVLNDEIRDLYNAENQLLKALPKMAKKATSQSLKDAFIDHLKETENHVRRLQMNEEAAADRKLTIISEQEVLALAASGDYQ